MRIVIDDEDLTKSVVSILKFFPDNNILIDHFLDRAEEAEIDAIYDGEQVEIMGVMEHIEPAGIHSGDSNAMLPPYNLERKSATPNARLHPQNCQGAQHTRADKHSVCH
jgi:carbamoyl-phosphate synthase large subunit